jgi:hypothetical protein
MEEKRKGREEAALSQNLELSGYGAERKRARPDGSILAPLKFVALFFVQSASNR